METQQVPFLPALHEEEHPSELLNIKQMLSALHDSFPFHLTSVIKCMPPLAVFGDLRTTKSGVLLLLLLTLSPQKGLG